MNALYQILGGSSNKEKTMQRMKKGHQELLLSISAYPDRFYGFGGIPLGMTDQEIQDWIDTQIVANNFKGIGEFTPGSDEQISLLEPVFKALQTFHRLPIWVHTFNPVTKTGLKLLMDLALKYPTVPVIFGHSGGYNWQALLEFARSASNAYIDTSATFSTLAARMLISELPDRCLFSSDTPYGEPLLNKQLIEFVSPSKEIADKVLGENIATLLSL